ncbi:MAG: GAF domain-containing protein [Nitrospirota bacterium]
MIQNRVAVQGEVSIFKNLATDMILTPWREEALKRDYTSVIGLPLKTSSNIFGVLLIYASEPDTFDTEELILLTELANDLAYGISTLRMREERKRPEVVLREKEAFIRAVMDNLPIGIAVNSVDPTVQFEYMNDNFPKYYRTTKEKLANPDAFWDAIYEDTAFREEIRKRVLDDCASGNPDRMYRHQARRYRQAL